MLRVVKDANEASVVLTAAALRKLAVPKSPILILVLALPKYWKGGTGAWC